MLQRLVLLHGDRYRATHVVVSLSSLGTIGQELIEQGVRVESLGVRSAWGLPIGLFRLYRIVVGFRPDVAQTWMYHADLLGGAVVRLARIKALLWGVRSTEIVYGSTGTAGYVRSVCARVSALLPWRIICAAEASRRRHVEIGYSAAHMEVIPNGFDVQRFAPLEESVIEAFRSAEGVAPEEVLIGFVGRYNTAKDVPNFLAAAQQVAMALPAARFVMVGAGMAWDNAPLAEAVRSRGLEGRVLLLGARSDVNVCLGALDVFCLSSRTEGFPNVVGEAMAAGVPCVVTDVGDAAVLVGDTAPVVPRENSEQLAWALLQVAALPRAQRRARGLLGRERIVRQFSMEEAVRRFDEVYHRAIAAVGKKSR